MSASLLQSVESKLDNLISTCHRLQRENAAFVASQQSWEQERKRLTDKNDIARKRIEAMIQHLKDLETES